MFCVFSECFGWIRCKNYHKKTFIFEITFCYILYLNIVRSLRIFFSPEMFQVHFFKGVEESALSPSDAGRQSSRLCCHVDLGLRHLESGAHLPVHECVHDFYGDLLSASTKLPVATHPQHLEGPTDCADRWGETTGQAGAGGWWAVWLPRTLRQIRNVFGHQCGCQQSHSLWGGPGTSIFFF